MPRLLNIFVPHCSDLLTDHLPHGDGLIAHGFITSLARRGHRLHVAAQRVELREALHPNITLHVIPLKRARGMQSRLEYMFRVRRLLRDLQRSQCFDLVHQLNPVFTGVSLALPGSNLPLVLGTYVARWPDDPDALTAGGSWRARALTRGRDLIAAMQQRRADALLLTTPAALNRLPDPQAVQNRIHLIPHGIDTDLFSPLAGWESPERMQAEQQKPSILFLANVLKRKGIFTLVEAFRRVAAEISSCILRIAGSGSDLAEVRRRIAALDCAHQVEFLGHQERADTPQLYRDCSVYCLPSFGEPYATTVMEAMSCARPMVVTDCGGLPYMVHESGGLRVPAGNPEALAQALIWLLQHPHQRAQMGRYNRERVESEMSWDSVAQKLEAIYDITLSRWTRPPRRDLAPLAVGLKAGPVT